jgi:hypothetical protein
MYLKDVLSGPTHRMGFGVPNNLFGSSDMPAPEQRLVRCISLSAFEAMKQSKGLNFGRFDKRIDPSEGAFPPFEFLHPTDPSPLYTSALMEVSRRLRRFASLSSWTMNDHPPQDLFELSERHGGPRRKVALVSSIAKVCQALNWSDDVSRGGYRGPVLYCDGSQFDVMQGTGNLRQFFWKDKSCSLENEYRFVYHPDPGQGIYQPEPFRRALEEQHWMRCSLSDLIDEVIVREDTHPEDVQRVVSLCEELGIHKVSTRKGT